MLKYFQKNVNMLMTQITLDDSDRENSGKENSVAEN